MPKMPIRKAKRVSVLTKRTQRWRNLYKEMISNTQLYEKLKINNGYLAKALSKEKQNLLLIKNVEPTGETVASQQLHLLCNVQNNVISNVLDDAKVIQKMLTPIIDQMTSTINMRQELIDSNHSTTMRLSSASAGRKKSSNKLSTKSATGVVKPTVDGKTITKTTINSSLVNTENINNTSRLSDLQEVTLPNTSEEINETRSPIKPSTSLRHRKNKVQLNSIFTVSCSQPENRRSEIDKAPTTTGHINVIGTRIDIETQESNKDIPPDVSDKLTTRLESQVLINSSEKDEIHVNTSKKIQWINTWNSREGASWMNMHNNTMSSRSYEPDSDISQVLSDDTRDNELDSDTSQVVPEDTRDNELDSDTSQVMSDDSSVTESDIEDAENRTRHSKYKALRRDMKNQINEMKADYKKEINDLKIRLEQALITTVRQTLSSALPVEEINLPRPAEGCNGRQKREQIPWKKKEEIILEKLFKKNIKDLETPSLDEVKKVMDMNPCLNRTYHAVHRKVYRRIKEEKLRRDPPSRRTRNRRQSSVKC